jgi:hypothetical protein
MCRPNYRRNAPHPTQKRDVEATVDGRLEMDQIGSLEAERELNRGGRQKPTGSSAYVEARPRSGMIRPTPALCRQPRPGDVIVANHTASENDGMHAYGAECFDEETSVTRNAASARRINEERFHPLHHIRVSIEDVVMEPGSA